MALTSTATAYDKASTSFGYAKGPNVHLLHKNGESEAGQATFVASGWGTDAAEQALLDLGWHVTGKWTLSSPQGEPAAYSAPVEYRS